jgi:hypothetical protein
VNTHWAIKATIIIDFYKDVNTLKRKYSKPLLAYEAYQLAGALAGDCNLKLNHYSYNCSADENGNGLGYNVEGIFFNYYNCQLDLTGPELDGADSVCYHGPVFTSGHGVFLGS